MKKHVLDSFAMIAFFEDEPGAGEVAKILGLLIRKKAKGFMSIVNWGEIYYCTMRVQGVDAAEKAIDQVNKFPIQLIGADQRLTYVLSPAKKEAKITG